MATEKQIVVNLPFMGDLTYREIHAFEDGLYCGYAGGENEDYDEEKHYWRMGYLTGDIVLSRLKNESE